MNDIKPILLTEKFVPKAWGSELWICNNEEFCGKILHFEKDAQFSCHFHVEKREVFYVLKGSLSLMTINPKDASQSVITLMQGDIIEIPRHCPHQIKALIDSDIIEFSTTHYDEDSFRMMPGDNQKK